MTLLYGAAACLVTAQLLGIYALKSRKADLIFSVCMGVLIVAAMVLGYLGARAKLG